jgi:protein pelota
MRLEKREKDRISLLIEDAEDLWYLSKLVEPGSIVIGSGTRKVAAGEKDVVKKSYRFELDVERAELQPAGLRILGTVRNEFEDVPKGSHQSILIEAGSRFELIRTWDAIAQNRLNRALERTKHDYLVVIFDRDGAVFSEVSGKGSREIERLSGDVARKGYETRSEDFFATIVTETARIASRGYSAIIIAASSMWIDELKKRSPPFTARYVAISGADSSSVTTLLQSREVADELSALGSMNEIGLVEELLKRISTGETYAYGFEDVERAVDYGAAETIIITQKALDRAFEKGTFERITQLLDRAEQVQTRIEIIDTDRQAMMKLDSLGGIAALLRFAIR